MGRCSYRYGTGLFVFVFVLSCFLASAQELQDGYKEVNFLSAPDGYEKQEAEQLVEEPAMAEKRQFLSNGYPGKRQFLSAGYGYAGKRTPEAQFISGKREAAGQFVTGKREPQFISGKRASQFVTGKRTPQFISGKKDSQFYSGKRDPQYISG